MYPRETEKPAKQEANHKLYFSNFIMLPFHMLPLIIAAFLHNALLSPDLPTPGECMHVKLRSQQNKKLITSYISPLFYEYNSQIGGWTAQGIHYCNDHPPMHKSN